MDRYLDTYAIRRRRLRELIRRFERETGTGQAEVARRSGMLPFGAVCFGIGLRVGSSLS